MKPSEVFKKTIESYIKKQAETDHLFALCLEKPGKNIDDCCTYILNWVKDSKCNGFSDAEIFGQAIHYYTENNVKIGAPVNAQHVVVNHVVELSEEDKAAAKQKAIDELVAKQREMLSKKPAHKKVESVESPTLF